LKFICCCEGAGKKNRNELFVVLLLMQNQHKSLSTPDVYSLENILCVNFHHADAVVVAVKYFLTYDKRKYLWQNETFMNTIS
jgi:hypothetical protein